MRLQVDGQDYLVLPMEQGIKLRNYLVQTQAYQEKLRLRFELLQEQNRQLLRIHR